MTPRRPVSPGFSALLERLARALARVPDEGEDPAPRESDERRARREEEAA